jgi:beta-galactosidase
MLAPSRGGLGWGHLQKRKKSINHNEKLNNMNRINTLFFCFVGCLIILGPPLWAQNSNPRQTILLDTGWRFHLGHAADPARDFNFSIANIFAKSGKAENCAINPKFDDKAWRKVQLPHDWAVELPFVNSDNFDVLAHGFKPVGGLYPETSIGWYRKQFSIAPADSGKRFFIRFDGIFRDAKIWLNGFYLGTNESGYLGVTYDISDYVDFNNPNCLVVRADATQYEGWFYEGAGIYRHVWLTMTNELYVPENGVFVSSEIDGKTANINIKTIFRNDRLNPATFGVLTRIIDRQGKIVYKSDIPGFPVKSRNDREFIQQFSLEHPRFWDLDDPYLYRVSISISENNRIIDSVCVRFGIRGYKI